MMKLSGKRLFSLLLAIFMVITMLPPNIVFAEDDIPVEEPSAPVCTGLEDCAAEIHEDGCPKKPADEPVKDDEPTKPLCTGLADCPAETHGEACEKKLADEKAAADKAAADAVAALIEALPTLEAIQAKPTEEQAVDYEQVMKAYDAFTALTDDQKALLSVDATFFDGYLTYFASLTQPAADHSHTVCGKTSCSCGSSHGSTVWQPLTSGTTSLTGGSYYLNGDVTLSSTLTVSGNVSLCLNGHTLTTTAGKIYISSGCLTICDCTGGGRITGASTNWSVIDLAGSGSLTVYSGTITSTDSSGTAISAYTTGDIQIRGGTVSAGRLALSLSKVNDLTVTSGSITSTSGCGISISQSFHNMIISGGTIKGFENGIYFDSCTCSGKVSISGGTIEATGTNVNAGGYSSRLYGMGFGSGNAGTCYVYITGGTVKGAKGGIYNFNPNLTMNISGGTLGASGTNGIESDRGTVNINGGKVYTVRCGGPATITVTNGEVYCVYLTAGAGSTGAGKLIVTGGTVGRVGSATSYYGIGNALSNPTGTISVEISGGTVVGSSYALYSVSQFSAKISGGTFSGATADIHMGKAPASFSTAYISMDGYSGDPLTFSLGTTVKPVAYLARQVANSSLITLVGSSYFLNYDPATKSVILTDIHTHSFDATTHKCSCGAFGGYCGDPSVNSGKNVSWSLVDGKLTVSGTGAMANYSSSTKAPWDAYKDDITSISVENGVTTVGDYAFNGLSSVTSATLADSVTTIGSSAFYLCSSMASIKMSAGLTSIGSSAFWRSGLTSIDIPAGVTSIGAGALQMIPLTSINVASGNTAYSSQDGVLFNKNKTTLIAYPLGREGAYFMPDSVTRIEESAFAFASGLSMVKLSSGLTSVNSSAFSQCTGLFTVVVPEGITAFFDFAFNGCPSLTVYYGGTEAQWNNIRFNSYNNSIQSPRKIYYRAMGTTGDVSYLFYDGTLTVYGNGDMADYEAQGAPWFSYYTEITKIVVEDGVTSIGDYAFDRCERASSITLSKDLTSIGEGAFQDCTSVTALTIPAGVTSIGDKAFRHCTAMKTLTFTGNAPTMGDAFYNIPNLTVYYPAGDSSWDSVAGKNYGNQYPVTWIATCGEAHDFENGEISYIWTSDYSSCTATLTCGNSGCMVSGSGNSKTVKSTSSREEATCSKPGKTVYTAVFSAPYETQTKEVPIPATGEHNYSKEVASAAFRVSAATCQSPAVYKKSCACGAASATETFTYGEAGEHTRDKNHKCTLCGQIGGFCGIGSQNNGKNVSWTLKDGVLTISGTGAMENYNTVTYKAPWDTYASEIVSVVVENGITSIGDSAFFRCGSLESVSIADTVTGIGSSAFSYCKELTDLKLPAGLLKIENDAFSNCKKLESVEIPAGVISIGSVAFLNCDALTSVVIPGSVSSIGQAAFSSCTALEDAYYAGTKANWDEISIGSDNNRLLDTRIHYNCTNPAQHWTAHNTEATCTDAGYSVEVCVCPTPYNRNKVETATALGHDMGQWLPDPDKEGEERSDCSRCDHYETRPSGPVILLEDAELQNQSSVWIDGASYPVVTDPDRKIVRVPENSNIKEGSALVTYEYHTGTAGDVHTQYPTGMKVWILKQQEDGNFTATRVSEFDNLLQYSGCSIRIVGVKGIRMITSINQSTKKALTGKGLAGYTLVEYGTALCRASALSDGQPMTLENPNVKYNYAYKKGVADPVFKYSGNLVQYTNVLVGFTDDDCKEDIAMRPYIILQSADGETVTVYGGIIYRSIGYIAYQNRNAFAVGSDAYEYVWSIIHHVYGDEFDADYKS